MKKMWLVFQWPENGPDKTAMFQGVFDTEAAAVAACRTELYCVCPANLNEELPHEAIPHWQGAYFPKRPSQGIALPDLVQ